MHRLLIVDDEELIVDGLYEIFRSASHLDLDVYKAYSGEEAISWLNRTRIDIVLTDINMPEIDGMQLMEAIHASWPQCKVIFLTGHSDFEYIYKAIQHPGVSYLLKTEATENVIKVVENAADAIQKEWKAESLIQKAQEQIHLAMDLFQKDFLSRLLKEGQPANVSRTQFKNLSIVLDSEMPVILLLGKVDTQLDDSDYLHKMQMFSSITQIINQYMNEHLNTAIILDQYDQFVVYAQPKQILFSTSGLAGNEETVQLYSRALTYLHGILEVIQASCQVALHLSVSFSVSGNACMWEGIKAKYSLLNHLMNARTAGETEVLFSESEAMDQASGTEVLEELYAAGLQSHEIAQLKDVLGQRKLALMEQYLETGQRDLFFESFEVLLTPITKVHSRNNPLALEAYYIVSMYLLGFINRWHLYEKVAFHTGLNKLYRADQYDSWSDAVSYLRNLAVILFELKESQHKKRSDNIISFLQDYIICHLGDDLSLVKLSEQVYLNPSYLSRIYKQETGANLSDFIEAARADKAKELLKGDKLKINEIAALVGYDTATSFTRFFRKATGISPQEFRSAYTNIPPVL